MDFIDLNLEPRVELGSGASGRLRRAGVVPAVIVRPGKTSHPVKLAVLEISRKVSKASSVQVFTVTSPDSELSGLHLLVKEVKTNPLNDAVIHVDFLELTEGHKIVVEVPLELEGQPALVKQSLGTFVQSAYKIAIACMPTAIPDRVKVDISGLDTSHPMHASDIKLPEGAKLVSDADLVICSVEATVAEEPKA